MSSIETLDKTFDESIAPSTNVASPVLAVATARVTNYLVRSGWGEQPAAQRAERLLRQVIEREGNQFGDLDGSAADLSRLVRLSISMVCKAQSDDAARNVIRPVLAGKMNHPMQVRPIGPLRADWWSKKFNRRRSA